MSMTNDLCHYYLLSYQKLDPGQHIFNLITQYTVSPEFNLSFY